MGDLHGNFVAVSYTHLDVYKRQHANLHRHIKPSSQLAAGNSSKAKSECNCGGEGSEGTTRSQSLPARCRGADPEPASCRAPRTNCGRCWLLLCRGRGVCPPQGSGCARSHQSPELCSVLGKGSPRRSQCPITGPVPSRADRPVACCSARSTLVVLRACVRRAEE